MSAQARGGSTPSGVQPPLRAPGRETTEMVNRSMPSMARKSQQGISLIEEMVYVLILAIGVLGVAALQTVALKTSGGAARRTKAAIQRSEESRVGKAGDSTCSSRGSLEL